MSRRQPLKKIPLIQHSPLVVLLRRRDGRVVTIPVGSVTNSSLIRYNDWQGSIRIDNRVSDRHSVNGRYIFNNDNQTGAGQATPTGLTNVTTTRSQLASIGMTSTLTERFFNELRLGFSRFAFRTGPQFPIALNLSVHRN